MFVEWIKKGLHKHGKDQHGLAAALGIDRSSVSKLLLRTRQLKANEIEKIAAYLEEPPPDRMMPVHYRIGAGQAVYRIDTDDPIDYEPVSGMWGVEAELAVVEGDSMRPFIGRGARIFFGPARAPLPEDHRELRVVRLADDRMLVKVMVRTADPAVWTLESYNAPPIEDVVVVAVAPLIRIEL
jgi:transcriptional regulator with XRE-family HTH domain